MGKAKYRTVVAAVLAGVVLFSPILCGKSCLEGRGSGNSGSVDVAAPVVAQELVRKIAESGVVGCVVIQVLLDVDGKDLTNVLEVGNWIWFGIEPVEWIGGAFRQTLEWM
jgi:hypothetical protein